MQSAGLAACGVATLAVLFADVVCAATGAQRLDLLPRAQELRPAGEVSAELPGHGADDGSAVSGRPADRRDVSAGSALRLARQDPLLERTRQRSEEHLNAQPERTGDAEAAAAAARAEARFGVGYEWRMRHRRQLDFGAPGGAGMRGGRR